jgi:hypothetical protein
MIDVTVQMLEFKEAVRHTWNSYFLKTTNPMSSEIQEAFSNIERSLLRVIVLAQHGMGNLADSYRTRPLQNIVVKPARIPGEIPIQFGKKNQNGNILWDVESMIKVNEQTYFEFFDFFDWDPYGHVDMSFVRARMPLLGVGAAHSGSVLLVEQMYCKFMLYPIEADV